MERVAGDGTAAEKKSLPAAEPDTADGQIGRSQWQKETGRIDPERLMFLDESGVMREMPRCYGRRLRGARVREGTPGGHWRTLTILGAIRTSGWAATMMSEATRSKCCVPDFGPVAVVFIDNLSAHKVAGMRASIQAAGAELRYLPPSSPDFNPIKKCWFPVKQRL